MSGESWRPTRTSADYTEAMQLRQDRPPRRCVVQYIRCMSMAEARERVALGGVAWVRREEWERVGSGADG